MLLGMVGLSRREEMSVPTSNFLRVDVRVLLQETLQGLGFAAAPGRAHSKMGLVCFVAGIESKLVAGIRGRRRRSVCLSSLFSILFYPLRGNLAGQHAGQSAVHSLV
jgi:hypothetical protein